MNVSVSFREAARSDLPEVLRLYAQPDLDDGKVLALPEAERIFARMARYPNYTLYLAICEGRVVGTFALLIMDNLGHMGTPSAIIEDVAVDPAVQARGIGRAMMRHALDLAGRSGCYKAVISSNLKRSRAHAFYDSLGFERHGYSFRVRPGEASGPSGPESGEAVEPFSAKRRSGWTKSTRSTGRTTPAAR